MHFRLEIFRTSDSNQLYHKLRRQSFILEKIILMDCWSVHLIEVFLLYYL